MIDKRRDPGPKVWSSRQDTEWLSTTINQIFHEQGILLEALLENYPGAIYFKDLESRIIRTSMAHARDFGMTTSNPLIGKTDFDLFAREHAQPAYEDEQDIIRTGKPIIDKVEKEVYPDGRIKYVLTTKLPLKDENGKIIGTFGISRDISDLKEAEKKVDTLADETAKLNIELSRKNEQLLKNQKKLEKTIKELQEAKDRLITSEKMASLGVLSAGIAHEINNPLNYISMGVSALFEKLQPVLDHYALDEKHKKAVEIAHELKSHINTGIAKTASIVRSLRNYSHSDDHFVSHDVIEIIKDALVITHYSYKDRIQVKTHCPEQLWIDCVPGELNQVFINLISNAVDSISGTGTIEIKIRPKGHKNIEISLSDSGKGIHEKSVSKLFDPFYTTKEVGQGTGLGLYIVYGIVNKHHGSIKVENQKGGGACFTITLPRQRT